MTLVVARSISDEIRVICDSKVTDPTTIRSGRMVDILKVIILQPKLCVCFAGNIGRAQMAMENLARTIGADDGFDLEEILDFLLMEHLEGERRAGDGVEGTDFIVGTMGPKLSIYRIAAGVLERDLPNAWIGDPAAFSAYQSNFHDPETLCSKYRLHSGDPRLEMISKMADAFRAVIQDDAFPSVGNFLISVTSKPAGGDGFTYLPSAIGDGFGTAAEGGFTYSILTPKISGIGALGVYFIQGRFGTLMYPARSLAPVVYAGVDFEEFVLKVKNDFGIELWRFGFR